MNATSRHLCLALLLGFLVGHASVAAHTATHVADDGADCEICSSYADGAKVLPEERTADIPREPGAYRWLPAAERIVPPAVRHVRQRGPPASI